MTLLQLELRDSSDLGTLGLLVDPTGVAFLDAWQQRVTIGDPLALIGAHSDLALTAMLVSWWANKNADGGGVLIQRTRRAAALEMARLAWFSAAHYLLRPWLWIGVGWAALVLMPWRPLWWLGVRLPTDANQLSSPGLLGLAGVGLVAALISTAADTHLHWGASYLANDLTLLPSKPQKPPSSGSVESGCDGASRPSSRFKLDSIAHAWKVLLVLGAGCALRHCCDGLGGVLRHLPTTRVRRGNPTAVWFLWGMVTPPSYAIQMLFVGGAGLYRHPRGASVIWPSDRVEGITNVVVSNPKPHCERAS